jgi:hypothetical protein
MFGKAIRLQDATARLDRARSAKRELAAALREQPEHEELRAGYRRALRELADARVALAQVVAESAETAEPADTATCGSATD